jgi:hypothetical protein
MRMFPSKSKKPKKRRPINKRSNTLTAFPEMKGRIVENIEVSVSSGYPCIFIRFQDKTDFTIEIDTCLILEAMYSDWKTGNQRVLKRWPKIQE